MSWTSIVFYLWRNTCRRWFESPISPLSKVLLVVVLSFFAVAILALFKGVEKEIAERLARRDLNSVTVTEFVSGREATTRLRQSLSEERMWSKRYDPTRFRQIWRAVASAEWGESRVGIFSFVDEALFTEIANSPAEIPTAKLLLRDPGSNAEEVYQEVVKINERKLSLRIGEMPDWMKLQFDDESVIVGPMALMRGLLENGYVTYSVAELDSLEEVLRYESEVRAFHRSEGNRVEVVSAANILRDLELLQTIQGKVRVALVSGCGFVLAVVMASMAWLEFRDDQYVLALLRSFGTPRAWLLVHSLWENVLLVSAGIALIPVIWRFLLDAGLLSFAELGIAAELGGITWSDLEVLALAGSVGCLLAILPVAFGLRKQVGLVLS